LDIAFRTRKLEKTFNSAKELARAYGSDGAKKAMIRLGVLKAAPTLEAVPTTPPDRRHELQGQLAGKYAVDLAHPYRLIFEPNHDPIPRKEDGGIDTTLVTAITIVDVEDYH
jgi:toxin HigB-1